jgi:hypothetical protein
MFTTSPRSVSRVSRTALNCCSRRGSKLGLFSGCLLRRKSGLLGGLPCHLGALFCLLLASAGFFG